MTISFTVSAFNDFLLNQLQLDSLTTHNLEIRLTSSIGGTVKMYSNVLKFTGVKPYAIPPKVQPPGTPPQYLNGKLFIVGSATPGGDAHGWDNPVPVPSQQFTRISATLYEITIALIGGKEYLFLPQNGSWSNKYACNSTSAQSPDGGDFGYNGSNNNWNANFPGPAVGGTYKISVDFQRGKYTVTKQ